MQNLKPASAARSGQNPEIAKVAHRQKVEAALTSLKEAEVRRKRATGPLRYHVNYRVENNDQSVKGPRQERYDHLVALIRELAGKNSHLSTSAWLIESHQSRTQLMDHLKASLDEKLDYLGVTQVGGTSIFGNAKLKS